MSAYKVWFEYLKLFPKANKYSLGIRIDNLFFEVIEYTSTASFSQRIEKLPYIRRAITKLDILKLFLQIAWNLEALNNKKYIILSEQLTEVGKMLGGWNGQLTKQNSPVVGEK